jgi:hypothetical protein
LRQAAAAKKQENIPLKKSKENVLYRPGADLPARFLFLVFGAATRAQQAPKELPPGRGYKSQVAIQERLARLGCPIIV